VGDRVLLIEDDSRLAEMVSEYLGKAGFHVVHAETGTRGLALHRREPADVVILDLMLPDATAWTSVGRCAHAPTAPS
jgi:two-component system phosphate regulon response regulator OmpR